MEPIEPQPGSSSDPRYFVGRKAVTQRALRRLAAGSNLALTDPRRMGKSFWMDNLCATNHDYLFVQIDYEGVTTAEEFLVRTGQSLGKQQGLPAKTKSLLRAVFENFEGGLGPVSVKVGLKSQSATKLLADTVAAVSEHTDQTVVVCMDEVPLAIQSIAKHEGGHAAREVLQTLRAIRRASNQIRWIVCGSVGFHHVLKLCEATEGDINDLENLPLGPLDDDEATELATRLFTGIGRAGDEMAIQTLVALSGGIAFIMHKVAALLQDKGDNPITAADVTATFQDFVEDRDESRAVTHLVTRLDEYYGATTKLANKILDTTAKASAGIAEGRLRAETGGVEAFVDVLNSLVDDHYLATKGGLVSWRYDVLRRIWSHRRRLGSLQ